MNPQEKLLSLLLKARGITHDSRSVHNGYLYFAIRGTRVDGHRFVKEAIEKGAIAVVVERDVGRDIPSEKVIRVDDTRKALGKCAHLFFGSPSESIDVVGITGTNGKTTTAHIIRNIYEASGKRCGMIGTVGYVVGDEFLGEGKTTPDQIEWHRLLGEMKKLGASSVIAEVSSHALDQKRVWGTKFRGVLFTNLTQDHLDYHRSMEDYFRAKSSLFTNYRWNIGVVNIDDPWGERLTRMVKGLVRVGKRGEGVIRGFTTDFGRSKLLLEWRGQRIEISSNLIGDFQRYNLALSAVYCLEADIKPGHVIEGSKEVHVPGRFEVIRLRKGPFVVIDYAHTPDAIDKVLATIRRLARGRVISVFGAGGDRDREKRPLMGRYAERWSDVVIITSDNPRSEDPEDIATDIIKGLRKPDEALIELDRRQAIKRAVEMAQEGDAVAVLGKGHEEYQEVGGVKYPFSDREVVKELL